MYKDHEKSDGDGIITLVKETADGFGHLIADHIKLARLELVADVKTYGRQVAIIAVIVPILFIGYGIVCLGIAAFLARWLGQAGALLAVGGAHVIIGAIAIAVAARRLQRAQPMHESGNEMTRSIETFSPSNGNGAPVPSPAGRD
jgi:hypothetical protein